MPETVSNPPFPPLLLEAISRIGFELVEGPISGLPVIPEEAHLLLGLFQEKETKGVRFYLRQLPAHSCFGQRAWQFAAFFGQIPPDLLPTILVQFNNLTAFSKAATIRGAKMEPAIGLFLNWYQGDTLDATLANSVAAQWRSDLYASLGYMENLNQQVQARAAAETLKTMPGRPVLD
jgi:hypothetical protein